MTLVSLKDNLLLLVRSSRRVIYHHLPFEHLCLTVMADTIISTISKEVFDYIVVGGGTAGLCLASRLSENPNIKVLVLEAGSNELANPNLVIPAMWIQLLGTSLDWHFSTVPQVRYYSLQEPELC